MKRSFSLPVFLLAGLLGGCGLSHPSADDPVAGASLRGGIHGGHQAVIGASIALYAAGATGNGTGAVNLLLPNTVTTDSSGGFNITGDYVCPTASTQVYLVARGGNPGLAPSTNNSALVLMAALGDCGNLSASTFIFVDEVTTAASAWALSQFLAPGAIVGSSATNATGLRNAFLVAANLANSATGRAPGALPPGGGMETAKLNTLANALAPCVNSDGTAACAPLFSLTGNPTNTLDAALNIVRNPAANVAALYNLAAAQGPFQPFLATAPNDWTLSLTYGQCASGCGGLATPGAIAIDSTGAVWTANYYNAVVSKFSAAGVPIAPNGYPGAGLRQSYGITVDSQDAAWVANEQSVTAANNSHAGSVSKFNSSGAELSGAGFTVGGVYYPHALAADSNGVIWVANYGASSATLLAANGTALSPNGYAVSSLPFTEGVALDGAHNAWFSVQGGASRVTPTGALVTASCCTSPAGIAVGATGVVWVADYGSSVVARLDAAGNLLSRTTLAGGALSAQSIAIDGAGNAWTANYRGNSFSELSAASGTVLSPTLGYGQDAPISDPYGIAIDSSGNVWISNSYSSTLTQFVGLAAPVRTPHLGPPTQP